MIMSITLSLLPIFAQSAGPAGPTTPSAGSHAGPNGPSAPSRGSRDNAASVLRTYDLSSIMVEQRREFGSRPVLPLTRIDEGNFIMYDESYQALSEDMVMELLYTRFSDEIEYEDRGMWGLEDGRLAVRAPESLQAEFARTLEFLGALTSARAELTIDVVVSHDRPLGSPELSGLVSVEQAESWLMNSVSGAERSRYVVELAPGHISTLDALESTTVVLEWDVEIAQGSAVHDPITSVLSLGRRLLITGSPSSDGLLLSLSLLQGELDGPPITRANRQRSLLGSEAGHDWVDAPANSQYVTVWDRTIACNSSLPNGQALVMRFDLAGQAGSSFHEAIIIRHTGGELPVLSELPSSDGRNLTVIDTSIVMPPSVHTWSAEDELLPPWAHLTALEMRHSHALYSILRQAETGTMYESMESSRGVDDLEMIGPWLFVTPQMEEVRQLESEGRTLPSYAQIVQASMLETAPVNLSVELRRGGPQGEVLRRAGLSIRPSDSNLLVLGVERTYEYGYDVEVAQHAGVADPENRVAFDGLLCTLALSEYSGGGLRLDLAGAATAQTSERRFEYAGPNVERAVQPSFEKLQLDESLRMAKGETERRFVLGNQFSGSSSKGLTLIVTVRR